MNKKLFFLPLAACALVACGGEPTTVVLTAGNVLSYNGTDNVNYGDSTEAVDVEGVKVTWTGVGCYTNEKDLSGQGFFQMRKKSNSVVNFECPKAISSLSFTLCLDVSNYDAVKPIKWTCGEETGTIDFTKDVDSYIVPVTPKQSKTASIAYDVDDGYTYTVYMQSITVAF